MKKKKYQVGGIVEQYQNAKKQDYLNFLEEEKVLNQELYGNRNFRNDNLNNTNLFFRKNSLVPKLGVTTQNVAPSIRYGSNVQYSPENIDYNSPVGPRALDIIEHKKQMKNKINQRLSKFKNGSVISDDRGQWAHPGQVTKINSNQITMQGVDYPVLGVSDTGHTQLMLPNNDYKFNGSTVTEYPMAKSGIHIKESKKGTFTKAAKSRGKGVQEFASQVLAHKEDYSSAMVKKANFAKNASKWKKGQMGQNLPGYQGIDENGNIFNQQVPALNWGSENVYAPNQFTQLGQLNRSLNALGTPSTPQFDLGAELPGILSTGNRLMGGIALARQDSNNRKEAFKGYQLSRIVKRAANSRPEQPKRKYYRPEDALIDPDEMINSYGSGTNFLAKNGAELQNGGFVSFLNPSQSGSLGNVLGTAIGGGGFGATGAGEVGSTIGGLAGTALGGPVGGLVGNFVGGALGGLVGGQDKKLTNRYNRRMNNNLQKAAFQSGFQSIQDQYTGFMKDGGNVAMDGQLKTFWGGKAETVSFNPFLPSGGESVLFKGQSHDDGGIGVKFGNNPVEVEGGEPAVKLRDGGKQSDNLVVFGNMKIPNYGVAEIGDMKAKGKKFKHYVNDLNKSEAKQNKIVDKNIEMINENPVIDSFDKLKLSSGQAMLTGANMNLKNIAKKKQAAANVQNAILDTAEQFNLDSDALAKGNIKKAKKGTYMTAQDGKRIARTEVEDFLNQGWQVDPENPNRLFKKTSIPGEEKTIYVGTPGKGGEEFNRAFAQARKNHQKEFNWKGKTYTTDLFKGNSRKISTPGSETIDYLDIYDPEKQSIIPTITGKPLNSPQVTPEGKKDVIGNVMSVINAALPYIRPSNQMPLSPNQLSGEMYALATNQLDPVQAQLYHPLLEQVSDISLQDQMNSNQADFNAISRQLGDNPTALASLAAQKYQANSAVLGEQFRFNQSQRQGVYNRNRGTLNDAQLKNLGILDQQYVRQSQAKSNTKATAQAALNSISSKIQQNRLENKTLGIAENLYNYRFGPNGYAFNMNPLADFNYPTVGENPSLESPNVTMTEEYRQKYDKMNLPQGTELRTRKTTRPDKNRNGGIVQAIKSL